MAKEIKNKVFALSRKRYPDAKIFGLTTGLAVMKINSDLGYEPVTYSELTNDEKFWSGCKSCVNYEILMGKDRKNCMCTAMLYDPVEKEAEVKAKAEATIVASREPIRQQKRKRKFAENFKLFERFMRFKQFAMLKGWRKKDNEVEGDEKKSSILSFLFFW